MSGTNAAKPGRFSRGHVLTGALAGGLTLFLIAAALAVRGDPYAFDREILLAMRLADDPSAPAGPDWLLRAAREITALGGTPVLTLLTVFLTGYFIVKKQFASLCILLAAVLGESIIVDILKDMFARARPDFVTHFVEAGNKSFPSGHSSSAAAIYPTLAAFAARETQSGAVRRYLFIVALLLALLVGASRLYLGVHFPTDVMGGFGFGAAWAAFVFLAAGRIGKQTG